MCNKELKSMTRRQRKKKGRTKKLLMIAGVVNTRPVMIYIFPQYNKCTYPDRVVTIQYTINKGSHVWWCTCKCIVNIAIACSILYSIFILWQKLRCTGTPVHHCRPSVNTHKTNLLQFNRHANKEKAYSRMDCRTPDTSKLFSTGSDMTTVVLPWSIKLSSQKGACHTLIQ